MYMKDTELSGDQWFELLEDSEGLTAAEGRIASLLAWSEEQRREEVKERTRARMMKIFNEAQGRSSTSQGGDGA
jgi:hypothetical protein